MKAASNALALSARALGHPTVMRTLSRLAEEELEHFRAVLDRVEQRGLRLGPPEEDWYAKELRRRSAQHRAQHHDPDRVLADRLLVGALIEARSCERFKLLARALSGVDTDLCQFYEGLLASEARHHTIFVELAAQVLGDEQAARARLSELAQIEASVVADLSCAPTIHG